MAQRGFVLLPLLELVADPTLPDGTHLRDVRLPPDAVLGARVVGPPLLARADGPEAPMPTGPASNGDRS
jgi:hypothetical protein